VGARRMVWASHSADSVQRRDFPSPYQQPRRELHSCEALRGRARLPRGSAGRRGEGNGRRDGRPHGRSSRAEGRENPLTGYIGREGVPLECTGQDPCRSLQGWHTTRALCPRGRSLGEHNAAARRLEAASHPPQEPCSPLLTASPAPPPVLGCPPWS